MMKKKIYYILLGVAALASCDSSDMPLTLPEEATVVTFNTTMGAIVTRAHDHRAWSEETDPTTMTVSAWGDKASSPLFNCQSVTYSESKWNYSPLKYWADLRDYNDNCYFIACMPHSATAVMTKTSNTDMSISATYSLMYDGVTPAPKPIFFDSDSKKMPLVTHGITKVNVFSPTAVNFEMDQTLAGYKFKFRLGDAMGSLRYFDIKEVKISGYLPYGGTMTCNYTDSEKEVTWSDLQFHEITSGSAVSIPNLVEGKPGNLKVTKTEDAVWSGVFYGIPSRDFKPTVTVKYDVYEVYEGHESHLTRPNVVSTIVFNQENFAAYTTAAAVGKINNILIKIVPSYLYVLSDCDQTSGFILAE